MPITATDIARQVPNAGSGAAIVENGQVVLRHDSSDFYVWAAESVEGNWEVFASTAGKDAGSMPQRTAPEIARALVRAFQKLQQR